MPSHASLVHLRSKATEMWQHLASAFVDSVFLALWAVPNVYIDRFIEGLKMAGIDAMVVRSLQILFGLSTLAPICIWLYKDIRIMVVKANKEIALARVESAAIGPLIGSGPDS